MKRIHTIGIVVMVIIAILVANFVIPLNFNNSINSALNPIDKTCSVNEDCVGIQGTKCSIRCGLDCVNKNWIPFCPLPENFEICLFEYSVVLCRCIDNICQVQG